jgi:hypothetical protein
MRRLILNIKVVFKLNKITGTLSNYSALSIQFGLKTLSNTTTEKKPHTQRNKTLYVIRPDLNNSVTP